jgi:hypothetical protein
MFLQVRQGRLERVGRWACCVTQKRRAPPTVILELDLECEARRCSRAAGGPAEKEKALACVAASARAERGPHGPALPHSLGSHSPKSHSPKSHPLSPRGQRLKSFLQIT